MSSRRSAHTHVHMNHIIHMCMPFQRNYAACLSIYMHYPLHHTMYIEASTPASATTTAPLIPLKPGQASQTVNQNSTNRTTNQPLSFHKLYFACCFFFALHFLNGCRWKQSKFMAFILILFKFWFYIIYFSTYIFTEIMVRLNLVVCLHMM